MPKYRVAHVNQQGQDMIIFPLEPSFGMKSITEQAEMLQDLEMRAHGAGLAGNAVIVWEQGKRLYFIGPKPWHPFLSSIGMRWVLAQVNRELSW
jgi:hypothetical protein